MSVEIFLERCVGCNICVHVCPDHVFDAVQDVKAPVIARPDQCQTCFLCELYCPEDALYVKVAGISKTELKKLQMGLIRHDYGWDGSQNDPLQNFWRLGPLLRAGVDISSARYAMQTKLLEESIISDRSDIS